ncbi:ATP-grasp domain-containing protein [Phycisphaeraceae bacterium D3-23]
MPNPVVVIAEAGGPLARAAKRAGYDPFVIDTLGTADAPGAVCESARFPFGVLDLIAQAPAGASVLLGGPMENHPDLVDAVTKGRELLGSSTAAMRNSRHPYALSTLPPFAGLRLCRTKTRLSFAGRLARLAFGSLGKDYLLKPRFESGGRGIEAWSSNGKIDDAHYLQQLVKGSPMSAAFHADGWSCQFLGMTEMLVGESAFGAPPFAWCGSIGPVKPSKKAKAALQHLGVVLTQRHDLRGVFGVDLVMDHRGNLWPIEVNPRFTESMEVIERATGRSALAPTGKAATTTGEPSEMHAKAAVFAKRAGVVGELPEGCVDARPTEPPIQPGERVCGILASGKTVRDCAAGLQAQLEAVYAAIETASH